MPRLPSISAFDADTSGWGFFLCTEKTLRTGRTGEIYLALTLADATGEVAGRVFENIDRLGSEFDAGEFVKVQGRVNVFNGRTQFHIESIRRVMTGAESQDRRDGFREELLLASAPRPVDDVEERPAAQVPAEIFGEEVGALVVVARQEARHVR